MKKQTQLLMILLALLLIINLNPYRLEAESGNKVYVLPIKGDITKASHKFLRNNINQIKKEEPRAIIFEIDTYGGLINEAINIKDLMMDLDVETIAFVNNKAESAGVLISIAADRLFMADTATIGSAEPIPNTEKTLSLWRSVLRDTARKNKRDEELVQAMADKDIDLGPLKPKGKLLNLTAEEALELKLADAKLDNYEDILRHMKLEDSEIVLVEEGMELKISKYLSSPVIGSILISLGIIGIVVEFFTSGIGVALSILSFGLYFGGNIMAGYAGATSVIIFITGIILLGIELIIPGFGLPGISGIILTIVGMAMAGESLALSIRAITIAIVVALVLIFILVKKGLKSDRVEDIILKTSPLKEDEPALMDKYLGREGLAATALRPSGFIIIDSLRLDALAEEGYIEEGSRIKVVRIEGSKITVRKI